MSPILSTVLFAAAAAAEMTTSMWLPAPYSSDEMGFYGSVIGANGDTVTMAVEYDDSTDMSSLGYDYVNEAETITFHGTTSFENVITTTDDYYDGDMTISYGCSKGSGRGRATCYYSSNGPAVVASYCSGYSDYSDIITSTELYTFDDPYTVVTQTETYDYRSYIPDVCASGESTLPESLAVDTLTMNRNSIETYQVVITAGEEKLSATAGSTPSNTAASATATGSSNSTGTIQPGQSGSQTASPSGTAASVPAGTGAAAPMITMAPALAGLGAAVAAFVL